MFSRKRLCGSGSRMLQNSQRMEFGAIRPCRRRTQARRQHALQQPAENATDADVDLQHPERIGAVLNHAFERDVVDANYFSPLGVDDLLVEKIAHHAQHVLVGMIRREIFVAEMNAVERNGTDLVVADRQPRRTAAADQVAIDANRIDQRNHRGVLDHTDSAPLEVKDLEAQKFGEEQELFRHRVPESIDLELLRILL